MTRTQKFLLLLIVVLAVFFRFYNITRMPGGLFPDEAANGLDINSMQSGTLQPFYERGNGREALFFYMLWGSVELFGKGPWQHHIVSALVGVLSVLVCFLLTRRLMLIGEKTLSEETKNRSVYIALLASFLMSVSTWHIVLSRTAFRANLIPLFVGLTFYFLLRTFQEESRRRQIFSAFVTGAVFALGFYSYIAYRILVPIVGILVLWPWLASGLMVGIKNWWKQFLVFVFAFCLFFSPLFYYFYTHPGSFVGRSGQVSVFNPDLHQGDLMGVISEVLRLSVKAYFIDGDLNWRHNISGAPFLSPIISPFFGVALIIATFFAARYILSPRKKAGWWKYTLLVGWFWGMLLPVITTAEGIPHGLRAIGTLPPVFILAALALYSAGEWFWQFHKRVNEPSSVKKYDNIIDASSLPKNVILRFLMKLSVFCFVLALVLQAYFAYFVYAANSPENFYAFRSDLAPVSAYLLQRCNKDSTFLVLDKFSVQTTDYMTSDPDGNFENRCNVPYKQVDPENSWELRNLKPGDEVVFTQSSIFDIKKFKEYHAEAYLRMEVRNKFGQAVMAVYRVQY